MESSDLGRGRPRQGKYEESKGSGVWHRDFRQVSIGKITKVLCTRGIIAKRGEVELKVGARFRTRMSPQEKT